MLRVLRKINEATLNDLHDPTGEFHLDEKGKGIKQDWLYLDKNRAWFRQGYVDNDNTHATAITEALMEGTESFAIWDDEKGIVRDGIANLVMAEKMRASAKTVFSVDIELPEDEVDAGADDLPAMSGADAQ